MSSLSGARLGNRVKPPVVLPESALAPADQVPEPPCALEPEARVIWDECCRNMAGLGVLARVDYPLLATWCVSFSGWCRVAERIAEIQGDRELSPAQKAWHNSVVAKLKAGEEVSRGDLREMERLRDADLIRVASLQIAAGRLLDQVERIGKQFGFSPASRIQLACMIKQVEQREDGEEYFREARL